MVAFLSALGSHLGFLPFVWSKVLPKISSNLSLYNDILLGMVKICFKYLFLKNSNNSYFRYKTKIASIISLKISVILRKRGKIEVQKIKLLYIYMYYRVLCSNLEYWYSIKPQDQDANAIRLNRVTSNEKLHFLPETERNVVWVGWVGGGIAGVGGAVVIPDCCNSSD